MRKRLLTRKRQLPDRMVAANPFRMQSYRILSHYQRMQFRTDRHSGSLFPWLRPHAVISGSILFACAISLSGLQIRIQSLGKMSLLDSGKWLSFKSDKTGQDICWQLIQVKEKQMTLPLLNPETDARLAKAGRRGTDSPLLRSKQVKYFLNQARDHTAWLFIEIFPEVLSVLDFKKNRAAFFYIFGSASNFKERWIGPAMLAPFLPNFGACLLHASAVVRHGKAAVFLAPDEGGKTTAARLSPTGTILGDDQVLVRRDKKGFRVSGTPWGRYVDAELQAPLAGLFLLKKADRFALVPCPAHEMIAHIWDETKNLLSILPKPLKKKAVGIVCDVVAAVPVWKLSFATDHIDWEAIDRALRP